MPILSSREEQSRLPRDDRVFLSITNWLSLEFNQTIDPSNLVTQAIFSDAPVAVTDFVCRSDNFCHLSPGSRWRSLQPSRSTTNESLNVARLGRPSRERSLTS